MKLFFTLVLCGIFTVPTFLVVLAITSDTTLTTPSESCFVTV
nr:MAG TPA: hypothetical protein [Caudoviricetes sp.]